MGPDMRTTAALGVDTMDRLASLDFCIVGCGGTGANFAEMLVRTGATRLTLIDGGNVKMSDLNRVFSFTAKDVGKPKVQVLANRFEAFGRPRLELNALYDSFRRPDQILEGQTLGQNVRDAVHDARRSVCGYGHQHVEARQRGALQEQARGHAAVLRCVCRPKGGSLQV